MRRHQAWRLALLTGWVGLLVATVVALPQVGLSTPPVTEPSAWPQWAAARDPLVAVFGGLQVLVVGLAWYLMAVTTIGAVARILRLGRLVAVADLVTLPPVRRLLQTALGVGLATAGLGVAGPPLAHEEDGPEAVVALQRVDESATAESLRLGGVETETLRHVDPGEGEAETLRHVDPGEGEAEALRLTEPAGAEQATPAGEEGEGEPRTWTAQPGDHLWAIAERTLADSWGRVPTDHEVVPYWRRLIDENRDVLSDPGNPDLIYPGQRFRLPDPPPAP